MSSKAWPKAKSVRVLCLNRRIRESFDRLAGNELRRQIQAPIGEAQSVEDHGLDGATGADDALFMHGNKDVDSLGDFEVLADGGKKAVVVERKGFQTGIGDFKHGWTYPGSDLGAHGSQG